MDASTSAPKNKKTPKTPVRTGPPTLQECMDWAAQRARAKKGHSAMFKAIASHLAAASDLQEDILKVVGRRLQEKLG